MEEVIDEPVADASQFYYVTSSSELVQYYYKLKYPDTYRLPSHLVLKLLDDKKVFSDLKNAVSSFVERAQTCKGFINVDNNTMRGELPVYDANWGKLSLNTEDSLYKKPASLFKVPSTSSGVAMYDSVHSIQVPLRTYKGKSRASVAPYCHRRRGASVGKSAEPTVAEVTQQMSGLVFDRVEKSLSTSLLKTSVRSSVHKRDGCLSVSPASRKQIKKVFM